MKTESLENVEPTETYSNKLNALFSKSTYDASAQYELGVCYENGENGAEEDAAEAVMWFREAAQLNYAPAHWRMSYYCRDGKAGVTQSLSDAMHHLQCAADLGLAVAMNEIGDIYDEGKFVPKNLKMSFDWHLKAAILGNRDAVLKIANDYAHGHGVRRSIKQAISWYCAAVKNGNPNAQNQLECSIKWLIGKRPLQKTKKLRLNAVAASGNS